jgi:hypothetical protein
MILWPAAQIISAWYYCHLAEWLIHRYLLHKHGTRKNSFWSFHFKEHHKVCRKNNNYDEGYYSRGIFSKWNRVGKESIALLLLGILHIPLFKFAPFFVLTVWASISH